MRIISILLITVILSTISACKTGGCTDFMPATTIPMLAKMTAVAIFVVSLVCNGQVVMVAVAATTRFQQPNAVN